MCPEASLNSAGGYGTLTPTTNRPVEMTSAGTVAAIEGTATGPATGASVAGRPSPWFASDFAAEIGVRNYPRLAVFSGDLRGAVHARSQWPSPSVEAVRGDQVGDLL